MVFNKYSQDNEETMTSKINSAGLINATLEKLWNGIYEAMISGDYIEWNTRLDAIWSILGGDCKEGDENDEKYNELNTKIYETGSLASKIGTGFNKKENPNNPLKYLWLLKKNIFLRRLQNFQGKGTAYDKGDGDDFE